MILNLKRYITSDGKYPNFQNTWVKHPEVVTLEKDAKKLIAKVSTLLSLAGVEQFDVTSGWRPVAHNFAIGGSANSHHIFARAIDILDPDCRIGNWAADNIETMRELGLYMESLTVTHAAANRMKRWIHFQTVAPKSGKIIFIP